MRRIRGTRDGDVHSPYVPVAQAMSVAAKVASQLTCDQASFPCSLYAWSQVTSQREQFQGLKHRGGSKHFIRPQTFSFSDLRNHYSLQLETMCIRLTVCTITPLTVCRFSQIEYLNDEVKETERKQDALKPLDVNTRSESHILWRSLLWRSLLLKTLWGHFWRSDTFLDVHVPNIYDVIFTA